MSDKKNNSPEIFKGKENEIKQEFEKKGYDWEKVKSELEKIEKKEEIDKKLTELEGKTEDYVAYLESLLKEKEKFKKTEPEKKGIVEKAVENGKKAVIEEAEKKGSFYGKIARFFLEGTDEKESDTFFTKVWNGMKVGIGMAILGFFGIKGISNLTENKKEEITQTIDSVVESGKDSLKSIGDKGAEVISENMKNKYSSIGLSFLKTFSLDTEKFSKNTDTTYLFSKFSEKTYSELESDFKKMDNNGKMNESGVSEFISKNPNLADFKDKKEDIYTLVKILVNQKTTGIIFRDNLAPSKIENILNDLGKEKIDNILGLGKFDEIKSKNFDFTKLDMKTNISLIGLSLGGFVSSTLIEGFESGKNFFYDTLFGEENIFNQIKSEFENRKSNLLPPKVLSSIIGENSSIFQLGGFERIGVKFEDLKTENLSPEEKEKLQKFLSFRDSVVSELVNQNSKFALGLGLDFTTNVKEILSLKEIIYLYVTFDGKTDFLNTSDPSKSGLVYAWLAKSFEGNKKTEHFFGRYASKIKENIDEGDFFTQEEKLFYNIILSKVITNWTHVVEKWASQVEGYSRQFLIGQLEKAGVPKEISNELAIAIEVGGGVLAFFVLKKFKKFIVPLYSIGATAIALFVISMKNNYEKYGLSKENYASVRDVVNVALKETQPIVEVNSRKIIGDSLDTVEQAMKNPQEVIDRQNSNFSYVLTGGTIKPLSDYKKEDYSKTKVYLKAYPSVEGDYKFEFNGKSYKFSYNIWGDINSYNPFTDEPVLDFKTYSSINEKGMTFGNGSYQKTFSYSEIERAFRRTPEKTTGLEKEKPHYVFDGNIILEEI